MSEPLTMRLFGSFEVTLADGPLGKLRSRKGQLLLAYLALRAGEEVPRDRLCDCLWPDYLLEQSRLSLRQSLNDLRKALRDQSFRIESPSTRHLRFNATDIWIDVAEFDRIAALPDPSATDVARAIDLYRAPLLADWHDEFLIAEQERRLRSYLKLLSWRAERALLGGVPAVAIASLKQAIGASPLHEASYRLLMRALVADGNTAEALDVFRRLRMFLRESLGVTPDPQTVELFQEIRASLQLSHQQQAKHGTSSGVYQLATTPRPLTPILGRDHEAQAVERFVLENRLVTITGTGGVGKTRLAIEVAQRLDTVAAFEDGIAYMSLSDVATDGALAEWIAHALGIKDRPEISAIDSLCMALRTKRVLLVLDNCEHLLHSATGVVAKILGATNRVHVLATSREPLGMGGEQQFPLAPLPVPDAREEPRTIGSSASCRLFVDRVRLVAPRTRIDADFLQKCAGICRHVDGIPLAIELAAAKLKTLSIDQVAERIDKRMTLLKGSDRDRPTRHQTMENAIESSYRMLSADEQSTLRALSIFEGGFTLELAEQVCPSQDTLAHIGRLIDASLVYIPAADTNPLRYSILETIREFGLARLHLCGEYEITRQRHFEAICQLVRELQPVLAGPQPQSGVRRIEQEQSNYRAALSNCSDNRELAILCDLLSHYWKIAVRIQESKRWLNQALQDTDGLDLDLQARLYHAGGSIAIQAMEVEQAATWLARAMVLARSVGDVDTLNRAQLNLGISTHMMGEVDRGFDLMSESVQYFRQLPDRIIALRAIASAGRAATDSDRTAEAEALLIEALSIAEHVGSVRDYAYTLNSLAWNDVVRGDNNSAGSRYAESIRRLSEVQDDYLLAWVFFGVGSMCLREGNYLTGAQSKAAFAAIADRLGIHVAGFLRQRFEAEVAQIRSNLSDESWEHLLLSTKEMSLQQQVEQVLAICGTVANTAYP